MAFAMGTHERLGAGSAAAGCLIQLSLCLSSSLPLFLSLTQPLVHVADLQHRIARLIHSLAVSSFLSLSYSLSHTQHTASSAATSTSCSISSHVSHPHLHSPKCRASRGTSSRH